MKNQHNNQKGFTLIEMVIYIALYSILIGGVVVSLYAILESNNRNQSKAVVAEEGLFILSKISWALSGAQTIRVSNNDTLSITRLGIPALENPLVFNASSADITLTRGNNSPQVINNQNVTVSNPNFIYSAETGDGINPENVKISFTLSIRTPDGHTYSQDFTMTKYIRK